MTQKKRIILLTICTILMLAIIIGSGFLVFKSCENNKVHADYTNDILLNPQAIVNFNQLVNNEMISGTTSVDIQNNIVNNSGDILYVHALINGIGYIKIDSTNVITSTINSALFTTETANTLYRIDRSGSFAWSNFNIINVSAMFGRGNEPSLQQCQKLFVAEYYPYNTGTPTSLNGLIAYNQALQDIFSSYTYSLGLNALGNSTYAVNYLNDESLFQYNTTSNQWYFLNTFATPLFTTISKGSTITLDYWLWGNEFGNDYYLNVMAYTGNGYTSIYTDTKEIDTSNGNTCSFTLPMDVDTLYFNVVHNNNVWTDANLLVFEFDISANQLDITQAIQNAYKSGYDDYINSLKPGNTIYDKIYTSGVADAESGMSVFSDSWSFFGSIFSGLGTILSVEFFPGLPIGLFVAFPLLLGLIFFIVKIAKGGS